MLITHTYGICTHIRAHMHAHTHARTHTFMHIHTQTQTHMNVHNSLNQGHVGTAPKTNYLSVISPVMHLSQNFYQVIKQ